jgi:hypothetical protein
MPATGDIPRWVPNKGPFAARVHIGYMNARQARIVFPLPVQRWDKGGMSAGESGRTGLIEHEAKQIWLVWLEYSWLRDETCCSR